MAAKTARKSSVAGSQAMADAPASFDYGGIFQRFNNLKDFGDFQRGYPNKGATICFVYRVVPVINRKQVGITENSIEKVVGDVVDEAYLIARWGSGKYHLKFNDSNRPQKLQQVALCTCRLQDPTAPAVYDPAELVVGDPENSAEVSRFLGMGWTIVETTNEKIPDGFRQLVAPGAVLPVGAVPVGRSVGDSRAGDGAGVTLDRETVRLLMSGRSNGAGGDVVEQALKLADRLTKSGGDPLAAMAQMAGIIKTLNPASAAPPDPFASLNAMADVMSKFGWMPPGGAVGNGSGMMPLLERVLSQVAMGFGTALAGRLVPGVPPGSDSPAAVAPGLAVAQPGGAVGSGVPVSAPDSGNVALDALQRVANGALVSFEGGVSGDDYAESLCSDPQLVPMYDSVAGMGKPALMAALASVPGLAERLAPKAAYEAWLDDFIAYGFDTTRGVA
jgi:hypothetical protein